MPEAGDNGVERILFITLSCIGDVVMSTPALVALHERYPEARIDVVADRRASQLLQHCPFLGEILHKDKQALLRGSLGLLAQLLRRRYDLVVDLRTDGLAWLLRARRRLTKAGARPYGPHSVERLMGVIRPLHGEAPLPAARIWLTQAERDYAAQRLTSLPPGPWLTLVPGSAGARARKAWPAQCYAALANALQDRFRGVVLLGAPGESGLAEAIAADLDLPYINATDTGLLQAAALLERCSLFVGSDSGLGHMAAAMAVPTLTLFGQDHHESCLPWGGRAAWLLADSGYARDIPLQEAVAAARAQAERYAGGASPSRAS